MSYAHPTLTGRLMLLITLAACLILSNLYYAQPILADIARDIGLERSSSGLIVTMGQIGYVLGLLLLAPLGDMIASRTLVALLAAGAGCGLLLSALGSSAVLFLAGTFLTGFFAVATQTLVVLTASLAQSGDRGRAMGILACGLFGGIALARPFSSLMVGLIGWRSLYGCAGLVMLVLAVALFRLLPVLPAAGRQMPFGRMLTSMARLLVTVPRFWPRAILSAGTFAAFSMFWSTAPLHLAEGLAFAHEDIALFALAGLATPPCVLLAGRLLDRGWSFRLLSLALGLATCAWLALLVAPAFAPLFVVAALCIDPAGSVTTLSIQQNMLTTSQPESRSRLNSLNISLNFCGGAIGAALGPWLFSHFGWQATAWTGFVLMLFLLASNAFLRPTLPQAEPAADPAPAADITSTGAARPLSSH